MFSLGFTQRIVKYLLFIILVTSLQCLATGDKDKSSEEDGAYLNNSFFRFTTERRYIWDDWTVATHKPRSDDDDSGYSGGEDSTIFFFILGVGIVIFVLLLFVCKRAREQATIPGSTGIPATNNPGRPGVLRQTSEKPPDYATVTLGDFSNAKSLFPSVMRQQSSETPPPKYDENNPMFK